MFTSFFIYSRFISFTSFLKNLEIITKNEENCIRPTRFFTHEDTNQKFFCVPPYVYVGKEKRICQHKHFGMLKVGYGWVCFSLQFLLDIARTKNALPLPLIQERSGLRLPPERYCLTSNNYKVKSKKVIYMQSFIRYCCMTFTYGVTVEEQYFRRKLLTYSMTIQIKTCILILLISSYIIYSTVLVEIFQCLVGPPAEPEGSYEFSSVRPSVMQFSLN